MRKAGVFILALVMLVTLLTGCATVGEIADGVMDAAKKELEQQIKDAFHEHKVEVVEMKTAIGHLNGDNSKAIQFYAAVLIQTNNESFAEECAEALKETFKTSGWMKQSASAVDSTYLEHKSISYDRTDFSAGNYYTVYVYSEGVSLELPDLSKN